jgi:outer membrane protein OmpA-like peptidoglycan-associated protein
MKRFILCALLVAALGVYNDVQAQFNSNLGWGLSVGGAQGSNRPGDKWGMQFRTYLQSDLISPMLKGQLGVGYVQLSADPVNNPGLTPSGLALGYSTDIILADFRLLFSPFTLPNFDPYLYAGFGLSRSISMNGGTDEGALAMIPFGVGLQTRISPEILLSFNIGHNLYLSDALDGRSRVGTTYFNPFTGGKQDGFYGFTVGAAFSLGGGDDAAEAQKKELAEAQARSVKLQADAEARRVKQQADANADAKLAKEKADADAKLAQEKAYADAKLAREKADADAKLAKESSDAAARRLAEQKSNDTVFVLIKGKTVVLRGVNFEFNKATLTKDSERILWRAYNAMVANPDVRVVITGHTDNVGGQKFNQTLSLKRAQAVKNWLVKKGIASNRMRTVGRGLNEPVASTETDAGRAENRRMEFYVEK